MTPAPTPGNQALHLSTLAGCALVIGGYPRFRYDASAGSGCGALGPLEAGGSRTLRFEAAALTIPPLDWRSTRLLGLPLPPGLRIRIEPEGLAGRLEATSGSLALRFTARFLLSLGSLYRAPALRINTELTTGPLTSRRHRLSGEPLAADGTAVLVGVATVEPCGEAWLDRFLGLPDEALAVLRCRFSPVPVPADGFRSAPPADRSGPGRSAPA